jgi:hypothetical protein
MVVRMVPFTEIERGEIERGEIERGEINRSEAKQAVYSVVKVDHETVGVGVVLHRIPDGRHISDARKGSEIQIQHDTTATNTTTTAASATVELVHVPGTGLVGLVGLVARCPW